MYQAKIFSFYLIQRTTENYFTELELHYGVT